MGFSARLLRLAEQKVKAGILSGLEKLRTEADLLQKKEELLSQEGDIIEKQIVVNKLLNLEKDLWILPKPKSFGISIPDFNKTIEIVQYASGEILTAKDQKKAARIDLLAKKWGLLPKLDASATYNHNIYGSSIFNSEYDSKSDWSVGLTFSYPIGNRVGKNNYLASIQALKKAENDLKIKTQAMREDLYSMYLIYENKMNIMTSLKARIKLAQKRVEIEAEKYLQGVSKFIELQEAQNEKVSIERSLQDAGVELLKLKLNILKTAGILPEKVLPAGSYRTREKIR